MRKLLSKVFGDPQTKTLKRLKSKVAAVNALTDANKKRKSNELKGRIAAIRKEVEAGKTSLDSVLPEVFAIVRETADRVLGQRHFDVQLIGGMVLHEGNVAEMKTGEGKTLVATLPVALNALAGKGVHVVTVNDYLAQRDAGWMGGIYDALGLSVGVIIPDQSFIYDASYENTDHDDERFQHLRPVTRQEAYRADITYGTNNEFGFDYLRDNMVMEVEQLRQRELAYAIVDEVDSILIDEARTPLIISAAATESASSYAAFAQITKQLTPDDYELDEKRRAVSLNDDGVAKVQQMLNIENLYAPENVRLIYHLDQALRAETLFKRDRDYVVNEDGEVIIVDEFTGRLMHGRRYSEGLHQAIEAKEGVEVKQESMTLATISFQNYFRLYDKLAGMTGTAKTEEDEFYEIYGLEVVEIPTNRPLARKDLPDRIYRSEAAKFRAIVNEVTALNKRGQPVLLGTASIEKNERLSRALSKAGITHEVLNAKNNEREAGIVAKAGQKGAVTLATNIAGRGTDIVLGDGVRELGGLFVLGSERHEARRIDNQLRGRSGRQGDPGTTQFYVSAEDDLMRIFGGERIANLMSRLGVDEETPIENKTVSKALENAQKKVENHNFDARKHVVQYDDVMNRHRKATYTTRQTILKSEDVSEDIRDMISVRARRLALAPSEDAGQLVADIKTVLPLDERELKKIAKAEPEKRAEALAKKALALYAEREKKFGKEALRALERRVYMQVLDTLWMQHLENMDHLREGINWRSIGQKDPLVEYRREGQALFEGMQETMESEIVRALMHAQPPEPEDLQEPMETELTRAAKRSVEQGASWQINTATRRTKQHDDNESRPATDVAADNAYRRHKREAVRKKKKQQRKNRKKSRR